MTSFSIFSFLVGFFLPFFFFFTGCAVRCFARSLKTKSSAILTFLNLDLDPVVLKSYKTYFSVMGQFSVQQRAFCVGHYMSSSLPSMTIRKFRSRYGKNVSTPSRQSILTWVEKFRHLGSLENQNVKSRKRPSHSGRPRTARTQLNFNRVQESVEECHETSARRRSLQLGLSLSSTLRILKSDLNLTPYHIQVKQKPPRCGQDAESYHVSMVHGET